MSNNELAEYMIIKQKKLYTTSNEPWILNNYCEFQDVFIILVDRILPKHGTFDYEINIIEETKPTFRPIYQLSQKESKIFKEYIDENLRKNYIQTSKSSTGYLIIFILKKDRSLWLYIDYQYLNSITIKDWYLLSLIYKMQDWIRGTKYFSKYDIINVYYCIRIKLDYK